MFIGIIFGYLIALRVSKYSLIMSDLVGLNNSLKNWTGITYIKQIRDHEIIFTNQTLYKNYDIGSLPNNTTKYIINMLFWTTDRYVQNISLDFIDKRQFRYQQDSSLQNENRVEIQGLFNPNSQNIQFNVTSNYEFGISDIYLIIEQCPLYCQECNFLKFENQLKFDKLLNYQCLSFRENSKCVEQCSAGYIIVNQYYCIEQNKIKLLYEDITKQSWQNQQTMIQDKIYGPFEFKEQIIYQFSIPEQFVFENYFMELDFIFLNYKSETQKYFTLTLNDIDIIKIYFAYQTQSPFIFEGVIIDKKTCNYSNNCLQIKIRSNLFEYNSMNLFFIKLNLNQGRCQVLQKDIQGNFGLGNIKIFGVYNANKILCQPQNCQICVKDNFDICAQCESGYYLFQHKCVRNCPFNSAIINNQCIDENFYLIRKGPLEYDEIDENRIKLLYNEALVIITQSRPYIYQTSIYRIYGYTVKAKLYLSNTEQNNKVVYKINKLTMLVDVKEKELIINEYIQAEDSVQFNLIIAPRTHQLTLYLSYIIVIPHFCGPYCSKCKNKFSCEIPQFENKQLYDYSTQQCIDGYILNENKSECIQVSQENDQDC